MSTKPSQAFRSRSSSNVIAIPTRHDPKSGQHVVRWKDVQQCFKDAQYVLHDGLAVMFLTDDDLEDLIPLRIAHHPGVILEVAAVDDSPADSSSGRASINNSRDVGEPSGISGTSIEAVSVTRDVASLRISRTDNNQTLVVRSQDRSVDMAVQQLPASITSHLLLGPENNRTQQETLHHFQVQMERVQQQMEEILGKIQQTDRQMEEILGRIQQGDEQRQHTQQDVQGQIGKILQTLQQMDRQHIEEAQRFTQQSDLYKQQLEEALQTSRYELQQRIEAVDQKIQQLDQETQVSRQHMKDIQQQKEQLLLQMREIGRVMGDQDRLSPDLRRQGTQLDFHHLVVAQYRVQAVLAKHSPNLPIPRFFIILPEPKSIADEQGESPSAQFRLYFLCECGSHTMVKDCNQPHEVHLANHRGYDLINQDQFINKYGSYLLTMMYMVKYGAKTRELVVPPLLGFNHAIEERGNIGRLVDETIEYLKETTGCIDGNTTAHQHLDATEFTQLKSHLKIKDDEDFSGGLCQMKIQKGHYAWICSDHWRESFESTLQQLKYSIEGGGGVWKWNEAKAKVTSEAMTKVFYNTVGKLFRKQIVGNQRSLTEVDWNLDNHQPVPIRTVDILDGPNDLESLSMDFDRLAMSINGFSKGEVKDVTVVIKDLSTLTLDDREFIQQCRPTTLTIMETPQEKDDRLINILRNNPSIVSLRISCDKTRHDGIDLVRSTREKMLQSGDLTAPRILELVHYDHAVKVLFDPRTTSLESEKSVKVENDDFIRQYGCLVKTIAVPGSFNDHHLVKLLDESTQEVDSRIIRFDITPTSLTTPGLDALSQVISRPQGLTYLRLCLENLHEDDQMKKALLLLGRHKDQLTSLRLEGINAGSWLPQIKQVFPAKDGFPVLEELFVESNRMEGWLSSTDADWLASVVSASSQPRIPLKVFGIRLDIPQSDREKVIKAIDLTTIEELHFDMYFFSDELKLLSDRIANSGKSALPMRVLDLKRAIYLDDDDTTRELLARIQEKVPQVEIRWK